MNKLFILCGMVFLGITSTPQAPEFNSREKEKKVSHQNDINSDLVAVRMVSRSVKMKFPDIAPENLEIKDIAYDEGEDDGIALGFDPKAYLPANFDPYKAFFDIKALPYIEYNETEEVEPGLSAFLPENFDPYAIPADIMDVSYIGKEDPELDFDTTAFLPPGFDPYERILDLDTVEYIEEEDLDLGFDTSIYLPVHFDPYSL